MVVHFRETMSPTAALLKPERPGGGGVLSSCDHHVSTEALLLRLLRVAGHGHENTEICLFIVNYILSIDFIAVLSTGVREPSHRRADCVRFSQLCTQCRTAGGLKSALVEVSAPWNCQKKVYYYYYYYCFRGLIVKHFPAHH